jgi:hypothetical protein
MLTVLSSNSDSTFLPFIWNEMFHTLQITMHTRSLITKNFNSSLLWNLLFSSKIETKWFYTVSDFIFSYQFHCLAFFFHYEIISIKVNVTNAHAQNGHITVLFYTSIKHIFFLSKSLIPVILKIYHCICYL